MAEWRRSATVGEVIVPPALDAFQTQLRSGDPALEAAAEAADPASMRQGVEAFAGATGTASRVAAVRGVAGLVGPQPVLAGDDAPQPGRGATGSTDGRSVR